MFLLWVVQSFYELQLTSQKWPDAGMVCVGDFDVHFKLLPGDVFWALYIGRATANWPDWTADNYFECKDALEQIQDVLAAFCKGGDMTQAILDKRYSL